MWKRMVVSSSASTESMYRQMTLRRARTAQTVVTTSCEVNGEPSLHFSPLLSFRTNSLEASSKPHSWARSGSHFFSFQ